MDKIKNIKTGENLYNGLIDKTTQLSFWINLQQSLSKIVFCSDWPFYKNNINAINKVKQSKIVK